MLRAIGETQHHRRGHDAPGRRDHPVASRLRRRASLDASGSRTRSTSSALVPETPARRAPGERRATRRCRPVERDVTAEVDGRRYSVRLWVPDLGPAVGAGAARPASRPKRASVLRRHRHGVGPGHRADAGHDRQGARRRRRLVEVGQTVCLLEAMKMENAIAAEKEGVGQGGPRQRRRLGRRRRHRRGHRVVAAAPETVAAAKDAAAAAVDRHLDELVGAEPLRPRPARALLRARPSPHDAVAEALRAGGLSVREGVYDLETGVRVPRRRRRPHRGGVRRVRRAPRDRPRLRAQHHRRHRGRRRPGAGVGRRRPRADASGCSARRPRRVAAARSSCSSAAPSTASTPR